MSLLAPITLAFRAFNTAANVYLAGQIGWWTYKKVNELQKEKIRSGKLKKNFIENYKAKNEGKYPSEELISVAMDSYNAVEYPWTEELRRITGLKK